MGKIHNEKKSLQLGMPFGTANARLRKMLIFKLIKKAGEDKCFRCNLLIESIDELSLEHKEAWLDSENPLELFFDLDNVSFSHLNCNIGSRRIPQKYLSEDERREAKRKSSTESARRNYDPERRRAKYLKNRY